jgi:uncharacterized protein YjiS (DUF1127 family)
MGDDFYFLRFEHRPLTPEQWDLVRRTTARRAHEERARALRGVLVAILMTARAGVAATAAAARRRWRAYSSWRERRAAIKELGGLDDRMLKDMGLHRSEIETVVGFDPSRLSEGKVAPILVHKPCGKRSVATNAAPKRLIERTAA